MKRMLWAIVITAAIVGGCKGSYHNGRWNHDLMDIGEIFSSGESDYEQSRRFWDQTPEGQRR